MPDIKVESATMPLDASRPFEEEISYLLVAPSGVLYDDTLWWRWLLQMLTRFGMHLHQGVFTAMWEQQYYDDVCCGRREFFDALREYLIDCGMSHGQIDELYAAGRLHWKRLELDLRTFPQTPSTLDGLARGGWRMGLLVQGPLERSETESQLQRMGILSYFEQVVYSQDVPNHLVRSESWEEVTHRLGVAPASIGFVSHNHRLLTPAREHGMSTFAYQCATAKADRHVTQLNEIPSLSEQPGCLRAA